MIEIFTNNLPFESGKKLNEEFRRLKQEILYILNNYKYANLSIVDDLNTIEFLLALAVFHRRVIANIESANSFTGFIFKNSTAEAVLIGDYELNISERHRLYAVVTRFRSLLQHNNISQKLLEYEDVNAFIKEVAKYKSRLSKKE
ncbi:MAG: hypothetical protein M5Z89_02015 [Olivibacter sp.]|nr:hypothetical protein [Olivibacter sp. UJ_SKK_5.1]